MSNKALLVCSVILTIVAKHSGFIIDYGFQMHGAAPKSMHMFQGFARVTHVQFGAFITVLEIEFAVAVIITILNLQVRKTKIGHVSNEGIANTFPTFFG